MLNEKILKHVRSTYVKISYGTVFFTKSKDAFLVSQNIFYRISALKSVFFFFFDINQHKIRKCNNLENLLAGNKIGFRRPNFPEI